MLLRPARLTLAAMNNSDSSNRYGSPNVTIKIFGALVALAMIGLGAIWTFSGSGAAQSIGPVVAGLGVALAYVVLLQKRR